MTTYVVKSAVVIAKNAEGGDVHVYQGAPVPDGQALNWIDRHLADGMIAEADEAVSGAESPSDDDEEKPARAGSRARNA